ncbi:S49 family peptidase [Winogradskyella pulchriflava]|uniref:S49 family peptidase n=1 Tax=Winogradskyella pulchriflava TaxID=1110688 RepID=A0ABV6QC84_9FLAO
MIFSKTASEIKRGIWFMEPRIALSYADVVSNILSKTKTEIDPRPEAITIKQALAPNGAKIGYDEEIPEGSIGVVAIHGPMLKYGDWCSYGADELVGFAEEFEAHDNIIGQIWLMDSGGGSVAAIAPYLDFLNKTNKPVVALCDLCASASYYVASATDYIMAENNISAMFGSIGVMIQFADYKKYYEKEGIALHEIYADQSKDKNLDFRKALENDYEPMKTEMLNPLAIQFQEHVKASRNLTDANAVLSGKMFYAEKALQLGLIDGIGNMSAAINKVKFLASARSLISNNY